MLSVVILAQIIDNISLNYQRQSDGHPALLNDCVSINDAVAGPANPAVNNRDNGQGCCSYSLNQNSFNKEFIIILFIL